MSAAKTKTMTKSGEERQAFAPMGHKPVEMGSAPKKPGTDGNTPILLIVAILAIIVVGAFWYWNSTHGAAPLPLPTVNNTNNSGPAPPAGDPLLQPGAVVLLKSFDRLAAIPSSVQMTFSENIDQLGTNVTLKIDGDNRAAISNDKFNQREEYWIGNATYACEWPTGGQRICAQVNQSRTLSAYAANINATFPNRATAGQRAYNTKLIQWGAIQFLAPPQAGQVTGRACQNIAFVLDYTKLNVDEMNQIGLSPADPAISALRNFKFEQCIDDQLGITLRSTMTNRANASLQFKREYTGIRTPLDAPLAAPEANANESSVQAQFVYTTQLMEMKRNCGILNASEHDGCVRTYAVNDGRYDFCQETGALDVREQCMLYIANIKNDPNGCPKSGSLVDECYVNIAANRRDASLCSLITNSTNRQTCIGVVANATANLPPLNASVGANSPTGAINSGR